MLKKYLGFAVSVIVLIGAQTGEFSYAVLASHGEERVKEVKNLLLIFQQNLADLSLIENKCPQTIYRPLQELISADRLSLSTLQHLFERGRLRMSDGEVETLDAIERLIEFESQAEAKWGPAYAGYEFLIHDFRLVGKPFDSQLEGHYRQIVTDLAAYLSSKYPGYESYPPEGLENLVGRLSRLVSIIRQDFSSAAASQFVLLLYESVKSYPFKWMDLFSSNAVEPLLYEHQRDILVGLFEINRKLGGKEPESHGDGLSTPIEPRIHIEGELSELMSALLAQKLSRASELIDEIHSRLTNGLRQLQFLANQKQK